MFTDSDNELVRVPLGKIDELVTFDVDQVQWSSPARTALLPRRGLVCQSTASWCSRTKHEASSWVLARLVPRLTRCRERTDRRYSCRPAGERLKRQCEAAHSVSSRRRHPAATQCTSGHHGGAIHCARRTSAYLYSSKSNTEPFASVLARHVRSTMSKVDLAFCAGWHRDASASVGRRQRAAQREALMVALCRATKGRGRALQTRRARI